MIDNYEFSAYPATFRDAVARKFRAGILANERALADVHRRAADAETRPRPAPRPTFRVSIGAALQAKAMAA